MAIHWQVKFRSLRANTLYTVNIYDDNHTDTPVQLTGAAQPFETQEDDDEDMFVPIRTQSGYLRIVDDGKDAKGNAWDWKEMIPATDTSRPVTLTANGSVVWQGFMQAQNFGSTLYGNPQEREFPVQCVLSVLGGSDINYTQTAIQNFAYLLKQIVDAIPSVCRPKEFYIQGGANAQEWLLKRIDWQNFVSEDADGLTARYTMSQCLEDMCRFWGWTARTKGTTMYLTCADDAAQTTWLKLTYQELGQLATYTSGTIPGDPSYTFETASLSGDIFASTNNYEYVQRGVKKATVSADGNSAEDEIIKAFPSSVENIMAHNGSYHEQYGTVGITYTNDLDSFNVSYLSGSCQSASASFNIASILDSDSANNATVVDVIRIKQSYASGSSFALLSTKYHHNFPGSGSVRFGRRPTGLTLNGIAYVKGQKLEDYDRSGIGNKTMYIRLGIGTDITHAKWFNGLDSWTSTANAFKVTLGNQTKEISTKYDSGHGTTSKKVIPLPTTDILHGCVFVEFLGSDDMPQEGSNPRAFDIADFSLEYVTSSEGRTILGDATKDSSATYKSSNGSNMSDEWGTDCIYASQNNLARGYGLVMNPDYSYLETLVFAGSATAKHPEQHLADRVTNFWQTSRRRLEVELRRDLIADITPRHKVTIDGMTGYPIAISHEWRDDVTQVTILQL